MARRRKRKKVNSILVSMVILLSICVLSLIIYLFIADGNKKSPNITGIYDGTVDITEDVAAESALYLSTVQGVEITSKDVLEYMDDVEIGVMLDAKSTGFGKGNYSITIDEDSYNDCKTKVYEAISMAMSDLIKVRLEKVGFDPEKEATTVEELTKNALGMSLPEYLEECEVDILPTLESLKAEVESSGEYTIAEGEINMMSNNSSNTHTYVYDKTNFVLTDLDWTFVKRKKEK